MERLRVPFLAAALAVALLIVIAEVGSLFGLRMKALPVGDARPLVQAQFPDCGAGKPQTCDRLVGQMTALQQQEGRPPGLGIPYLALVDGILLFTALLLGLQLAVPERALGRLQGPATLIVSLIVVVVGIVVAIAALAALVVRMTLLLAFPFGTISYIARFGFFNRGGAGAVLGVVLLLKLAFGALLVAAHQRFVQNKGLLALLATSLVVTLVVSFLHNLVPLVLVSITDAIAALVVAVVGTVWGVVLLVGSIVSIAKVRKAPG